MKLNKKQYRSLAGKIAWKKRRAKIQEMNHLAEKQLRITVITFLLRKKGCKDSCWKCVFKVEEG